MRPVGRTVEPPRVGRSRGARRARDARALRVDGAGLGRHPRVALGRRRRADRRDRRAGVAALPGRRRAGVRGEPDGCGPDPGGAAGRARGQRHAGDRAELGLMPLGRHAAGHPRRQRSWRWCAHLRIARAPGGGTTRSTRSGGSGSRSSRWSRSRFGDGHDPVLRLVVTALTVIWGVRLAVHLHLRNHELPRGPAVRAHGSKGRPAGLHMFVRVYLCRPRAVVRLAAGAGRRGTAPGSACSAGSASRVWLIGFGFETIGDEQLRRFKADPANKGKRAGHRAVALHPAPQLLRRRLRVVGPVPAGLLDRGRAR